MQASEYTGMRARFTICISESIARAFDSSISKVCFHAPLPIDSRRHRSTPHG